MKKYYPLLSILLINSIPIAGVFVLGWNVYQIIYIYWIESLLVGVFNIIKMIMAKKPSADSGVINSFSKIGLLLFFCFHYFFFLLILGVFIFTMVLDKYQFDVTNFNLALVIIMLIAGCTTHFITDYILPRKYLSTAPSDLFFAPYGRVWILAALILAGGFIAHKGVANQYFYLVVLVFTKFLADVFSFLLATRVRYTDNRV